MKKALMLLLLIGVGIAQPSYAAEDQPELSLWDRLRKKIELLTPKKKLATTTAVGGVRGAQAEADDVYWKDDAHTQSVDEEELAAFKKAISLVDVGDMAGAEKAFAAFLSKHPDSRLGDDAQQALAQLKGKK